MSARGCRGLRGVFLLAVGVIAATGASSAVAGAQQSGTQQSRAQSPFAARPGFVFEGFLNPVAIVGEVRRPGDYHLVSNLTVGRFLNAAGGLTSDADGFVVVFHFANNPPLTAPPRATLVALLRQGAAIPQNLTISRIPIADYALNSTLRLEPQDILFVPSRSEV